MRLGNSQSSELFALHPRSDGATCLLRDFKLHWSCCLLLKDHDPALYATRREQVRYPQPYQVTATQLAVERQIEHRKIACPAANLQAHADAPHVDRLECELRSSGLPAGEVKRRCVEHEDLQHLPEGYGSTSSNVR